MAGGACSAAQTIFNLAAGIGWLLPGADQCRRSATTTSRRIRTRDSAPGPRLFARYFRAYVPVDFELVLKALHVSHQLPLLGPFDRLLRRELDDRPERLALEHVLIGKGLEVHAAIGIRLAFLIAEALDEQGPIVQVADPAHLMSDADLGRALFVLAQ